MREDIMSLYPLTHAYPFTVEVTEMVVFYVDFLNNEIPVVCERDNRCIRSALDIGNAFNCLKTKGVKVLLPQPRLN